MSDEAKRKLSKTLLATEPALRSSLDFGPSVRQGDGGGPALLIGDQAEIPLYQNRPQSHLDYRMTCLATGSDIVVVRYRDQVFEDYIRNALDLPDITFVEADPNPTYAVTKQVAGQGKLGKLLTNHLARARGLTIKPYLTKGTAWRLAQHLGTVAAPPVHVCGPSPRLSQRVNDKLWFADLARRIVGCDATPPSKFAYGAAAAAGLVCYLAKRSARVVVKVPDSAGSAGNIVLQASDVQRVNMRTVQRFLLNRLTALGWSKTYPILVGVWDENVICSPSVQMWIPHAQTGPPVIDGIFEQRIRNMQATFVGAARSRLPGDILHTLKSQAVAIAEVLQNVGYYGRCSLDAVLRAPAGTPKQIHWIECNGRWGGVSIPITLARRLTGDALPRGLIVIQERQQRLSALKTADVIASLDGLLYDRCKGNCGIIILSPPHLADGVMVNLLVMANTHTAAEEMAGRAVARIRKTAAAQRGQSDTETAA